MSFFYDGIDCAEIHDLHEKGILRGITTNLTLVNNQKKNLKITRAEVINPIVDLAVKYDIPISVQLEANTTSEMIVEGEKLYKDYSNVSKFFVKVPIDFEKLKVVSKLSSMGVKINATCITSTSQAQMATTAGASIVSFFWGKMSDQGINPFHHVSEYSKWKYKNDFQKVLTLVGSIRQISTIYSAFEAGSDVVTTGYLNWKKYADQLLSSDANSIFQETNITN
jgi:transaldolase